MECRLEAAAAAVRSGADHYPLALPYGIAVAPKGAGFYGEGTNLAHNLPLGSNPHTDLVAAERHFAQALDLAGFGTTERLRLLPKLGEALILRNRAQESAAVYEEAIAGLEARGEVRATALAMCR